jgi:hypothetical protein
MSLYSTTHYVITWREEQGIVYTDDSHTNNLELHRLDGKQFRVKKFSVTRAGYVQTLSSAKVRNVSKGIAVVRYRFRDNTPHDEFTAFIANEWGSVYHMTLLLEVDGKDEEFVCAYPSSPEEDYTDDDDYSEEDCVSL